MIWLWNGQEDKESILFSSFHGTIWYGPYRGTLNGLSHKNSELKIDAQLETGHSTVNVSKY